MVEGKYFVCVRTVYNVLTEPRPSFIPCSIDEFQLVAQLHCGGDTLIMKNKQHSPIAVIFCSSLAEEYLRSRVACKCCSFGSQFAYQARLNLAANRKKA